MVHGWQCFCPECGNSRCFLNFGIHVEKSIASHPRGPYQYCMRTSDLTLSQFDYLHIFFICKYSKLLINPGKGTDYPGVLFRKLMDMSNVER
jgi:hypothetical protein